MLKKLQRGFTLIELLVVIAIIALLLAILMPSLGKAKDKAKQIVCKSHLKDIGLSINMFLHNNDNKTPEEFGGFYRWINPATNREYEPGDTGYRNTYWGIAFKDYAKNKKIFSCPSFGQFKLDLASSYIEYAMDDTKIEGGYGINEYFEDIKVTSIRTPSKYIITQDHVEPHPESRRDGDLFFIKQGQTYNVPNYRQGGNRTDRYRGLFRHSKKNSALDTPAGDPTRRANINNNPNGQSDMLLLDGSVDAMDETTGENVRESWYTGGIAAP